jgi:hypothetical protein
VALLRSLLKPRQDVANSRVAHLRQKPLIHRGVLDLRLDSRFARFGKTRGRRDLTRPSIFRRLDAKAFKKTEKRVRVALFGFDDIHKRSDRTKSVEHALIGRASLVLIVERLAQRSDRLSSTDMLPSPT